MVSATQRPGTTARTARGRSALLALAAVALVTVPFACQSAYYSAMERFGVHKRDILVDRVKDAREDQAEAKERFVSTFDRFKELTSFDGGDLEARYKKLNAEYEDCSSKADDVRKRIKSVEDVAGALFSEWKTEIGEIQNPEIKKNSQASYDSTQARYGELVGTMKKASAGMDPVLTAFKDHVLALKHNLNAQAISSLSTTVTSIQNDVSKLIEDMQRSIAEADSFISSMGKT